MLKINNPDKVEVQLFFTSCVWYNCVQYIMSEKFHIPFSYVSYRGFSLSWLISFSSFWFFSHFVFYFSGTPKSSHHFLNSKTVLLQKPHQHHIKNETWIRNMARKMKWKPSGSQCRDKCSVDKSQHQDRYLKHQNPTRGKKSCPGGKWDDKIEHQGTWSNWSKMELKRISSNSIATKKDR